jgi:hypothetical protein
MRRKEEVETAYAIIVQSHEDSQAEFQAIESDAGSDISELDPLEEERIRNLQSVSRPVSSVTAVSKRFRSSSSLLTSRSSSVKRRKPQVAEEDVVI